ncbi:DUF2931 family protein [Stutzerimonas azotifigens]|uniref:DUF2931 family protein n=1 Tax=Stutzerimonas azotifigens TaxID=291995 RepID=UPI000A00D66C|nr:DUF2931 family protein [Stutzerimonas azotifigens]
MTKAIAASFVVLLLYGCQSGDPLSGQQDPHARWWSLGFTEPNFMTVWVEDSAVVDINGLLVRRISRGRAAGAETDRDGEVARGWDGVGGDGVAVVGADLPQRIYVRWQSIVEPETYRAWVEIPEHARQLMRQSISFRCSETPTLPSPYRATVSLGLAPGGIVQVWVWNQCYRPVRVARAQAEIEPLGPDLGRNEGRYGYQPSEKAKRYIERYGIPYGSW